MLKLIIKLKTFGESSNNNKNMFNFNNVQRHYQVFEYDKGL